MGLVFALPRPAVATVAEDLVVFGLVCGLAGDGGAVSVLPNIYVLLVAVVVPGWPQDQLHDVDGTPVIADYFVAGESGA